MAIQHIQGQSIDVRSLSEGENNHDRLREWIRDVARFIEASNYINSKNALLFHRDLSASSTESLDPSSDNMYNPGSYGLISNPTVEHSNVFDAFVFIRSSADFGEGYSQYNLELADETKVKVEVDYDGTPANTRVRITEVAGSPTEVLVVVLFFPTGGFDTTHTPTVS